MSTPPRWTQESHMQRALNNLFRNNTIVPNDTAAYFFDEYQQLWPQNSKGTFSKYFTKTKERFFGGKVKVATGSPAGVSDYESASTVNLLNFNHFPKSVGVFPNGE